MHNKVDFNPTKITPNPGKMFGGGKDPESFRYSTT